MALSGLSFQEWLVAYMEAYKDNLSTAEFAEKIGGNYNAQKQRYGRYIKMGVKLPPLRTDLMGRPKYHISVEEANRIVEAMNKETK